jgi:hypothetical protein
MTDFYALLKQSIVDRGLTDESERREMYAQARRAVIKQLWDYRPPLAADEIDMRVGSYDTAVERIEADIHDAIASGQVVARRKRAAIVPAAAPAERTPARKTTGDSERALAVQPAGAMIHAAAARGGAALAAARQLAPPRQPQPQPAAYDEPDEEELLDEEYAEEAEEAEAEDTQEYRRAVRWSGRGKFEQRVRPAPAFEWPSWLGTREQAPFRIAAIFAGVLFVVLVAIISYELGARTSRTVTLPIGVHREISDAATAARIPNDSAAVAQTFTIFDGTDPTVFDTTPDNPVAFDNTNGFVRVSSSTSAPGVKVSIGPGIAARLAGKNIRVVIVARASVESGAAGMRFAYQSGLAISHWQTANLGSDFAPLGIEWRVPAMRTSPSGDDLLIEPGIPGDGTGVDVKSIRIDVLKSDASS